MCKDPLKTMNALDVSVSLSCSSHGSLDTMNALDVNVGLSYSSNDDEGDEDASLRTVCIPSENKHAPTSTSNNNNNNTTLTTRQEMYLLLMADRSQVCDGRSVEMLWRDCITNTATTTADVDVDVDRSSHVKRKDDKVKRSGIRHRLSWHGINSSKKNDVDDAQLSVSCHNSHRLSWYIGSSSKTSDIDARLSSSCHNHSHDITPSSQVEFQGQQYKNKSHPNSSSSIGNGLWNSYIPVRGKKKKDTMLSTQPSYIIPDPQIKTSRRPSSSSSHRPSEGSLVSVDGSISQSSLFEEESSVTSDDPASPKEDEGNDDHDLTGASFDTVEMSPVSSNDKKSSSTVKNNKKEKTKKKAKNKNKNKNKKKNKQQAVVLPRRSSDQSLYTSDPNLLASASREQEESTMINDYLSSEADAALSRSAHTHNSPGNVTRRRKFQPRHRCQSINDSVTGIVKPPRYTTITSSSSTTNSSSSQANTTSSTIATSTHSTDNNNTNSRSPTPRLRRANRRNSAPNFALLPRQLSGSFTQLKPDEIEKLKDTLLSIGSSSSDDDSNDDDEAEDNNDHDDENNSCTGAEIEKGGYSFRRSASTSSNGNTVDYVDISTHSNASWIPTGVDFSANMEVYVFQKNEDV